MTTTRLLRDSPFRNSVLSLLRSGQTAALNESEIVEEGAPTTAPATGEQAAPAEGAEAPKEG